MIKRFDRHRNLIICEVRVLSSHIMDKFGVLMVARIFRAPATLEHKRGSPGRVDTVRYDSVGTGRRKRRFPRFARED